MMIAVSRDRTGVDVRLMTDDHEVQSAVRFDSFDDAVEFAETWSEWLDGIDIQFTLPVAVSCVNAAA